MSIYCGSIISRSHGNPFGHPVKFFSHCQPEFFQDIRLAHMSPGSQSLSGQHLICFRKTADDARFLVRMNLKDPLVGFQSKG